MSIFLLIIFPLTLADIEYSNLGDDGTNFQRGTGNFNEFLTDTSTPAYSILGSKTIGTQNFYPLVDDLDNDGTYEIILMDGDTIRVYQNNTLDVVTSFDFGTAGRTSNIITYDIDGDGTKEVIFTVVTGLDLFILDYDGFNFSVSSGSINMGSGEHVLGCKGTDDCAIVSTATLASGTATAQKINIIGFNSTLQETTSELIIDTHNGFSSIHGNFCLPKFKLLDVSNDVYTFSYAHVSASSGDRALMISEVTKSGSTMTETLSIEHAETTVFSKAGAFDCASENVEIFFTAPLVESVSSSFSGDEIIFGLMDDLDKFKIYTYKSDGSFLDDYPEFEDGEGNIVSNVMLFNAFEDTGIVDFCVMGHDDSKQELDLVCGSEDTGETPTTREYTFSKAGLFNVTDDYQTYNILSHAVQYSEVSTDGTNLNELLTSYGVFRLNSGIAFGSCELIGDCSMSQIFSNPKGDSVIIPTDYESNGLEDLLILTDTNLYYLDDGFTNTKAQITSYTINPCIDAVWKQNTSVNVQIEVTDIDGDLVNAYASLYDNTPFEINESSLNASSETTFSFFFTANETITNGLLTLIGQDVENPLESDSIPISFTVANEGVEFGDCSTTSDIELIGVGENASIVAEGIDEDNVITTAISSTDETLNLGLGNNLIWLIIMAVITIVVWTTNTGADSSHKLGIIGIVNVILLIIGTLLGFISTGIIITIVVVAVAIVSLALRNKFTGQA